MRGRGSKADRDAYGGLVEHEKPAADQEVLQGISARPRWAQNDEQRDCAERVDERTAKQDAETLRGQAHKPEHHAPEHERKKAHHRGTIAFAHSPHAAASLSRRITKPPYSTGAQAQWGATPAKREKRRWVRAGHGGRARSGAEEAGRIAVQGPQGGKRHAVASGTGQTPIAEREISGANSLVSARFSRQTRNRRYAPPTRRQQLHGQQERCSSWQSPRPKAR